MEDVGHNVEV